MWERVKLFYWYAILRKDIVCFEDIYKKNETSIPESWTFNFDAMLLGVENFLT